MTKERIKEIISEVYKCRYPLAYTQIEITDIAQINVMHTLLEIINKIDNE